ncbi:unnamed protein product [Closterium sp. Yama58-4]|nr:unnamed protein product [Closterium sp. Yama58-4]
MGMIEELLESPLEEWQRAELVDARACAGEMVELINRVLDLAKLQAGRLQLETLPCCLCRIVHEAATLVKRSAHSADLQVPFNVDENVPRTLLGDPVRLSQVISELVDTGGGIPPEELRWVLDPHGESCHSMDDTEEYGDLNGKGQQGLMEKITLFWRSESQSSAGNSSPQRQQRERSTWDPLQRDGKAATGPRWTPYPVRFLLSTSLVAEMRGGMAVLSDAATGTTILLALPMGGGEDASSNTGVAEGSKQESEEEGEGELGGLVRSVRSERAGRMEAWRGHPVLQRLSLTLLLCGVGEGCGDAERVVRGAVAGRGVAVVDDNAVNRMVARRTLQGYGAHVLLLCSGEDALQSLSSATPSPPIHLLLLDLHMPPGIDGFETARQVRAMENTCQMKVETSAEIRDVAESSVDDARVVTCASGQRLCIIALTADLDAGIKRACLEAGMDGAVRKPIVAQELAAALSAAGIIQRSE